MSPDLQIILLDLAAKDLPKIPDSQERCKWQFQISKDPAWLEEVKEKEVMRKAMDT